MWPAQTTPPGVPAPSDLKDLPTPVAILLLCLIILAFLLFYFGGALRERLTPKAKRQQDTGPAVTAPLSATAPVAEAAQARLDKVSDDYTGNLLAQIAELKRRVEQLERDKDRLTEDLERCRRDQASYYRPRRRD